ncbi:MAG: ABC transporter permease [Rhizobiales bacterium]|nr:ABC transporter permease [Hyphomicrobiales bacterium]
MKWPDTAELGARYGVLVVLALIIFANALLTPNFATFRNVEITLIQIVFVLLVGTGMTLVIATGGIDLSVGAVMGFVSVIAYWLLDQGLLVLLPVSLLAGLAIGALNGVVIATFNVQPILITLGSLIWVRGLAQFLSGGRKEYFDDPAMHFLGTGRLAGIPVQVLITAVVVAIVAFLVARTVFGRQLVAAGGNRSAARLAGVPIRRTIVVAYAASGLLAALAGVFITARVGSSDPTNFGVLIELDAIAAVVVGGTALTGGRARVLGTVVGALVLQFVTAAMIMNNVNFQFSLLAKALIILAAVYLQRSRAR